MFAYPNLFSKRKSWLSFCCFTRFFVTLWHKCHEVLGIKIGNGTICNQSIQYNWLYTRECYDLRLK